MSKFQELQYQNIKKIKCIFILCIDNFFYKETHDNVYRVYTLYDRINYIIPFSSFMWIEKL